SSAFLLQSCEELAGDISEVKVKMPLERITFDVDSAVMAQKSDEIVFAQYTMDINSDSIMNSHGVDYLNQAAFTELVLGIVQPQDMDMSFLEAAKITVSSTDSFEEEFIAASVATIDPSKNSVELVITDFSVTEQIRQGVFYVRIYGKPNQTLPVRTVTLFVEGKLQLVLDSL
ncbi:MAG: hypothetical protein U9R32_06115, partial [Bacteroidota bacterium]|nr:hypothetical protein [Bacteroidota bacterium]